ncbi:MAG: HAMP domain-containing protein [Acetatifactor sp.]|nr:HAMP domain-containing protein [Acetatifactor sp.]
MKLKFGLRARFIAIFLIAGMLLSVVAGYITGRSVRDTIWEQYRNYAIDIANLAVTFIDGDSFVRYAETLEKDEEYEFTQENLNRINRSSTVAYLYAVQLLPDDRALYIFDSWGDDVPGRVFSPLGTMSAYDSNYTEIAKPLATKKTTEAFEKTPINEEGYVATIYAPIINSAGDVVGVLGVDMAIYDIEETVDAAQKKLFTVMISLILFLLVILLVVVQNSLIRPVRVLRSCVEEMAGGRLGVQAPVKGNTELADISRVFNQMSSNISAHLSEMEALNSGYHKFVPEEIFRTLQKDVTQIRLGDFRNVTLTVLSMGICDFDKIANTMASRELFTFINRIYQEAVPPVEERGGVIVEFYKDGFWAFHQTSCQEALDSAIVICQQFHDVREQMKYQGVNGPNLSIGIGHGKVILGIVGDKERLEVSMLSEQITAAEHLRGVARKYRAQILITGTAAAQIPDFENQYSVRFIGLMQFKISGSTDQIYDVYDGDSMEDRHLKTITKDIFEEGVNKFLDRQYYEARRCFIEVLKTYRSDAAAKEYLFLCDSLYRNPEADKEENIFIEEC